MLRINALFCYLQYKMLGEQEAAMDKYTDALHVYMDVTGKNHVSYAATLANLGVLYKDMSKGRVVSRNNSDDTGNEEGEVVVVPVKGMEKLQLLERAEEALVEARDTRISLLGGYSLKLHGTACCTAVQSFWPWVTLTNLCNKFSFIFIQVLLLCC